MTAIGLDDIGPSQRDRLFHIDFCTLFLGVVRRGDLIARFGIAQAAATRDLSLYRSMAPENLLFDRSEKSYRRAASFKPLFPHDPERSLHALSEGIGDDASLVPTGHIKVERPIRPFSPSLHVISAVSRAIAGGRTLRIQYLSLSSGATERIVAPHALVDSGMRWHMRAYDERSSGFRDFVLSRVEAAEIGKAATAEADREHDEQWMRIVPMELVPHPGLKHPAAVAADYGMIDGVLRLKLRASLVGYVTQFWGIDTTPEHVLDPLRHQLWLKNTGTLYGVESLNFAPGS